MTADREAEGERESKSGESSASQGGPRSGDQKSNSFDPAFDAAREASERGAAGRQESHSDRTPWKWWEELKWVVSRFFSSGFFFMCVGATILTLAWSTFGTTHGSFSFVLVVLGAAVLLYGTGTQSLGSFSSEKTEGNFKVALAGGAGVLALVVGFGMVRFSGDIRDVFAIEQKLLIVEFVPTRKDDDLRLEDYIPRFSADGINIPSKLSDGRIIAYVPYLDSEQNDSRKIMLRYEIHNARDNRLSVLPMDAIAIKLSGNIKNRKIGREFAFYEPPDDSQEARALQIEFFPAPSGQGTDNTGSGVTTSVEPPAEGQ